MKILNLGIGSATPHLQRFPSAAWIEIENIAILIDCGEATQYRILENKLKPKRLKYILISHLHGDHYQGLIGLLSSLNMNRRTDDLIIYGPNGLKDIISLQLRLADTKLHFKLFIFSTNAFETDQIVNLPNLEINTFPLKHRVPCTGFILKTKTSKYALKPEAVALDLGPEIYAVLSQGKDYKDTLNGISYLAEELTTPPTNLSSLAYVSDTIFDEEIIPHVKGVDLLYHESTFLEEHAQRAQITFHSTAKEAAHIAKKAQVKKLLLGHFSARYDDLGPFLTEAKMIFKNTVLAEQGKAVQV